MSQYINLSDPLTAKVIRILLALQHVQHIHVITHVQFVIRNFFHGIKKKLHTHGNYQCFKQDFYGNFLRFYIKQSRREIYARALYPLHPFTRTFIIYGN